MPELLTRLSDLSVQIFAVASMASMGLRYGLEETGVLVMAVVVSLVTMAVLFPGAKLLARRADRPATSG